MHHNNVSNQHGPAKPPVKQTRPIIVAAALLVAALSGCAQVSSVKPGTPVKDVISKFGKPAVSCILKDGTRRLVYTTQPAGEQAWATTLAPNGTVVGFEQVLTDSHFSVLSSGQWTVDRVRCEFGPAAEVETLGSGDNQRTVWSYRYMRDESDYMMMNISFDVDTNIVIRYSAMPDPGRDSSMVGTFIE